MNYKIISDTTSDYGTRKVAVAARGTVYTIKDTDPANSLAFTVALYNEAIRLEPNEGKRQDLARERYAYENNQA